MAFSRISRRVLIMLKDRQMTAMREADFFIAVCDYADDEMMTRAVSRDALCDAGGLLPALHRALFMNSSSPLPLSTGGYSESRHPWKC